MTERLRDIDPEALRHTPVEDAVGLATGVILVAVGVHLFTAAGLVTGQTAGLALLIDYATPLDFGTAFFLVNLPFYGLAVSRMGWTFTLKTLGAVTALSVLTWAAPTLLPLGRLDPVGAAVAASVATSVGLIVLFRHRASLGGVGVLALYLQEKTGFRAGWTQMAVDAAIFAAAFLLIDWRLVLVSALGAAILNYTIALNHRADRYIAR